MALKRKEGTLDVVSAAKARIINIFNNRLPVYMSFSGGKDSLCLADIVVQLIQAGKIDASQLIVQFFDEEAIFPCIEATVKEWRRKFILLGATFMWFCVEVKHFNCFNALSNDESFICWDSMKRDVWIRQPPDFAICEHKELIPRVDTYQRFQRRYARDGVTIVGVRSAESIQRLQYMARMFNNGHYCNSDHMFYPIYDWTDNDVWLYIKDHSLKIPDIYLYLWQSGTGKRQLRVSQFFSVDTARSLVKMNEYYPDLLERIIRREPNAYLAALYWDSEMFGRRTKSRKELEEQEKERDYREELINLFNDIDRNFPNPHHQQVARQYRRFFISVSTIATQDDYRAMYEGVKGGDPKLRTLRALYMKVYGRYVVEGKEQERSAANAGQ